MANLRPKVLNANGYDELLDDGDNIQLVAAPATDDAAANKEYVDTYVDTVAESLQSEIDSIVNPGGDPVYVRKTGDNMTGDLTLGTDKVTLGVDGSAVLAGGITAAGNVGIGTPSPSQKLQVTSGNIYLDGTDQFIYLSSDNDQWLSANSASNYIRFGAANQERMRIDSSGNVGIGTIEPQTRLDVVRTGTNGDLESFRQIRIGNDTNPDYCAFIGYANPAGDEWALALESIDNGNPSNVLIAPSGGNVGIGTDQPSEKLEVNGNATFTGSLEAASIDGGSY